MASHDDSDSYAERLRTGSLLAAGFEVGFPYLELPYSDSGIERFVAALLNDNEAASSVPLEYWQLHWARGTEPAGAGEYQTAWDVAVIPDLIERVPSYDDGDFFFSYPKWHVRGKLAPSVDPRVQRGVIRVHVVFSVMPPGERGFDFGLMQLVRETPTEDTIDSLPSLDDTISPILEPA